MIIIKVNVGKIVLQLSTFDPDKRTPAVLSIIDDNNKTVANIPATDIPTVIEALNAMNNGMKELGKFA